VSRLVLVAEADPFSLRLLEEVCEDAGYDVVTAGDGSSALGVVARDRPAVIVLDARLRTEEGAGVLDVLRSEPALAAIPILLTASEEDLKILGARNPGRELGPDDFVARPFRAYEVERRLRSLMSSRRASILPPADPTLDPLTLTGSPRQLRFGLDYEASRAGRYGHALTCLVVSVRAVDGGPPTERLLVRLAQGLRAAIRNVDHLYRSGEDEFAVLLPETPREAAEVVRGRLLQRFGAGTLLGDVAGRLRAGLATNLEAPKETSTDGVALLERARETMEPFCA
jgi:two-component system cell cycle response regulator